MDKPQLIQEILRKHSIVEYLDSAGHSPASTSGGRWRYSCPLHGPENDPSFYVFDNKEFENYKCFGCGAFGDLINLVSAIESISLKDSVRKLAKGISIDDEDVLCRYADNIEANQNQGFWNFEDEVFQLNRTCYEYLRQVEFDAEELEFMEEAFKKIDTIVHAMDLDMLRKVGTFIIEQGIPHRLRLYRSRQDKLMELKYKMNS